MIKQLIRAGGATKYDIRLGESNEQTCDLERICKVDESNFIEHAACVNPSILSCHAW